MGTSRRDLFNEKADVVVCDGFTNVVLKQAESFYSLIAKENLWTVILKGLIMKYGGTPVLGLTETLMSVVQLNAIKYVYLEKTLFPNLHQN